MNPGQRSMDYGQWADHPLTIDPGGLFFVVSFLLVII